jgi:L-asparaginase
MTAMKARIALISTGGTIEKSYDEMQGVLQNKVSNLDVMLATLALEGVEIIRVPLMNKDSLEMTPSDHLLIAQTVGSMAATHEGVVVVHGTDRLAVTGEKIVELHGTPRVPVVLTGAMRPYVMRNSDALQNLTEALCAVQVAAPGVYVAMHNRVLRFPGVVKDPRRGTFVRQEELARR